MSFNDEQDFKILSVLKDRQQHFERDELEALIHSFVGVGFMEIMKNLEQRGLIHSGLYQNKRFPDNYNADVQGYIITNAGRSKYQFLLEQSAKEKKNELIAKWTFWIVIAGAIASILGLFLK